MRLHTITFGCQMSSADGDELSRPLLKRGFSMTPDLDSADAAIVNTCTVRQHAEDRALSAIGRLRTWKEADPDRFLIVAGCAAERLGPWIQSRFPHVDLVVGAKSIERYPEILETALRERFDWARDNSGAWPPAPAESPSPVSAYVTVMRGCNYSCTYCIVPAVRGRELYRPMDIILKEVGEKAAGGAKEIILLGQTVNSYRDRGGADFADLLRATARLEGVERIRFMSPHPHFLDERMMRAMAETPKVAPHLHLPVQSGSDRVLQAMRRNYSASLFLEKVAALRALIPDLALTTDVIVGFPGETEADFAATLGLLSRCDVSSAYCFKFSPRKGTPAAEMGGQIPEPVKDERLSRLLEAVDARTRRHLEAIQGTRVQILLETPTDGRTRHYFKARLSQPALPGALVDAVVSGATATALRCERAGPPDGTPQCAFFKGKIVPSKGQMSP